MALLKWTPFDFACRLRSLQQGSLNVGNTQQNKTNLYNLAVTQANGSAVWAKWRGGNNVAQSHSQLLLWLVEVPGYVAPGSAGGGGFVGDALGTEDGGIIGTESDGIIGLG